MRGRHTSLRRAPAMPWYLLIVFAAPLLVLIVGLGFRWVIIPAIVHSRQTLSAVARYAPVRAEQLTPETRDFIAGALGQLMRAGFETVANVTIRGAVTNTDGVHVLLVRRASSDVASIVAAHSLHIRSLTLMIRSEFADGTSIVTSNSRDVSAFPRDPSVDSVSFPWVRDAAQLYAAHERRLPQSGRASEPRVAPQPGREIEYLQDQWTTQLERFARSGYFWLEPARQVYRHTWKGSYLMSWRLTEPVKSWRRRRRDRAGKCVWHELAMENPAIDSPGDSPDAATLAPVVSVRPRDEITYESKLLPGEIRLDVSDTGVTVRVGVPTRGRALASHWTSLIVMALFGISSGFSAWALWRTHQLNAQMRALGMPGFPNSFPWGSLVFIAFLLFEARKVGRAVLLNRGTIRITASRSGLSYHNVQQSPGDGSVVRDDVESLVVRPAGGFRRLHQLELRRRDARRPVVLACAADRAGLDRARTQLARALGIEIPWPPPLPSDSVDAPH